MQWFPCAVVWVMTAGLVLASQEAGVVGDRVNLRARPLEDAEVLGQVNQGARLTVLNVEGDWAEVQAPTNVGVWIKNGFVADGLVKADKVNVRSGPGVSYRSVGVLRSGTAVQVKETRGEWVCMAPPPGISVWIKKSFLDLAVGTSPAVESAVAVATGAVTVAAPMAVEEKTNTTHALPEGLRAERLAPVLGQGAVLERQGIVERVPMAIFRGVEYRLVDQLDGKKTTICYVRGRETEMAGMTGKRVTVKGRGWWLSGEHWPLIYPDSMAAGQ